MALPTDVRITWYGHSCFEIVTPGGKTVIIDPWFGNPSSPRAADSRRPLRPAARHPRPFRPPGRRASPWRRGCGRPGRACTSSACGWPASCPGGADQVIGMNKGGTVEAAGLRVTMTTRRPLGRRLERGRRDDALPGRSGRLRHRARDRLPHLSRRRHASLLGDMALIRDLYRPDLAMLPIGGHFTMGPERGGAGRRVAGRRRRRARCTTARSRSWPGRRTSCAPRSPPRPRRRDRPRPGAGRHDRGLTGRE